MSASTTLKGCCGVPAPARVAHQELGVPRPMFGNCTCADVGFLTQNASRLKGSLNPKPINRRLVPHLLETPKGTTALTRV